MACDLWASEQAKLDGAYSVSAYFLLLILNLQDDDNKKAKPVTPLQANGSNQEKDIDLENLQDPEIRFCLDYDESMKAKQQAESIEPHQKIWYYSDPEVRMLTDNLVQAPTCAQIHTSPKQLNLLPVCRLVQSQINYDNKFKLILLSFSISSHSQIAKLYSVIARLHTNRSKKVLMPHNTNFDPLCYPLYQGAILTLLQSLAFNESIKRIVHQKFCVTGIDTGPMLNLSISRLAGTHGSWLYPCQRVQAIPRSMHMDGKLLGQPSPSGKPWVSFNWIMGSIWGSVARYIAKQIEKYATSDRECQKDFR